MFDMEPRSEAIGKLKKVIVRVTHNGIVQDFEFNVHPNADTSVVSINLDSKEEKK